MRRRGKITAVLFLALLVLAESLLLAAPLRAAEEGSGLRADSLTVRVGYYGGPFYDKYVFSLEELWALPVVYEDYTYIDAMPSVVVNHVAGARLTDILRAAGIDSGSVQTLHFWTNDKQSGYYTSYSRRELLDAARYCYPGLPAAFTEEGLDEAAALIGARPVPTLIALADDWKRVLAGGEFGSDFQNLNTDTRFRLIFGQISPSEQAASRSAKWVHAIEVVLGGAPTLTLDAAALELEVGSVWRLNPRLSAADPLIAANLTLSYASSDPSVASVDAAGNITVHREGEAVITVSAGGAAAELAVNGLPGEKSASAGPAETDSAPASETAGGSAGGGPEISPAEKETVEETRLTEVAPAAAGESAPDAAAGEIAPDSAAAEGGVQNWRVYAMADTATELGDVPPSEQGFPLRAGLAAAALFSAGFGGRALRYRRDL